jgi:hypothetical protein
MHGTWHPIPFNEDGNGMVGYKFGVTWICSTKEPIKIRFCKKKPFESWKGEGKGTGRSKTCRALLLYPTHLQS